MLSRLTIACLIFVCSMNASAARGFFINKAELVTAETFYDGSLHVFQLHFKANPVDVDETKVNCAVSWDSGKTTQHEVKTISWRSKDNPSAFVQMYMSIALTAYSQGKLVDLSIRNDYCGVYGHGLTGIRFSE